MPRDTSIKEIESDLVKRPAFSQDTSIEKMEVDLVTRPAEVNAVVSQKKRRGKRRKRKACNALWLQIANQASKNTVNPACGKNVKLQDTLMDVDTATLMFEEHLKTDVDSTTVIPGGQDPEAANRLIAAPLLRSHRCFDANMNEIIPAVGEAEVASRLFAVSFQVPESVRTVSSRRKLLILDLNGLLADIVLPPPLDRKSDINISGRAIFKRPFYYDFLKFCFERFDVGVWSSRSKKVFDRVVDYLFGDLKHKLLFCWDMSHCTMTRFKTLENRHKPLVFKELKKLWEKHCDNLPWERGDYDESNTVLLDDSPYKALLNPMYTSVFPFTYSYKDAGDKSLDVGGDLRVYLEGLATAETVQTYIEEHPFGQHAINEKSSLWDFYYGVLCNVSTESNRTS